MVEDELEQLRQDVAEALANDDRGEISAILERITYAEAALLLDSMPAQQRADLWPFIDPSQLGLILLELQDDVSDARLAELEPDEIAAVVESLSDVDDQADLLLDLPADRLVRVLHTLDAHKREQLEAVLAYDEDTAGGLMNLDQLTVRADVSLDVVLRYLRMRGEVPDQTDQLFVVDRHGHYLGALYLSDLLVNDPDARVSELMRADIDAIYALSPATEVAREFENFDLISAPVVDDEHKLIGRITIDDVVDVIRDEGDHGFMGQAGLSEEEDMFSPVLKTSRRRGIWLGINLLTAFLAAWVIGFFENILDQVVALAILITIVPSMGGIAGSQTLTIAIRGLALGQLGSSNYRSLIKKEIQVGLLNGLLWAVVVASFSIAWFGNFNIGFVIAFALVVNLVCGAFAGAVIPVILRQIGVDPAIAGGVVLTTVTDVVGIIAFLGLATLVLG